MALNYKNVERGKNQFLSFLIPIAQLSPSYYGIPSIPSKLHKRMGRRDYLLWYRLDLH